MSLHRPGPPAGNEPEDDKPPDKTRRRVSFQAPPDLSTSSGGGKSTYYDPNSGPPHSTNVPSRSNSASGDHTFASASTVKPGDTPADPLAKPVPTRLPSLGPDGLSFAPSQAPHSSFAHDDDDDSPTARHARLREEHRQREAEMASNAEVRAHVEKLRLLYSKQLDVFDMDSFGQFHDEHRDKKYDADQTIQEFAGTLQDRIEIIRGYRLRSVHLKQIGSVGVAPLSFSVDLIALFENACEKVASIIEQANAFLPWARSYHRLEVGWHIDIGVMLSETYPTSGAATRAFKYIRAMILRTSEQLEQILGIRSLDVPLTKVPPLENVEGYFRSVPSTPSDATIKTPNVATSVRRLTAKEIDDLRRANMPTPEAEDFYSRTTSQLNIGSSSKPTPAPSSAPGVLLDPDDGTYRVFTPTGVSPWGDPLSGATGFGHQTLHDAVTGAAAVPPTFVKPSSQSQADVSNQLHVQQPTPGAPTYILPSASHAAVAASYGGTNVPIYTHYYGPTTTAKTPASVAPAPAYPAPSAGPAPSHPGPPYGYNGGPGGGGPGKGGGGYGGGGGGYGGGGGGYGGAGGGGGGPGGPGQGPPGGGGGGQGPPAGGGGGFFPPHPGPPYPGAGPPQGPGGPGDPFPGWNPPEPDPDAIQNPQNYPRIDTKMRPDDLPAWDGSRRTALEYLMSLRTWSRVGGLIPHQIGTYAPLQWTGAAKSWWDNLTERARVFYGSHVRNLIYGIRYGLLTDEWVRELTNSFNVMSFREPGHSKETPVEFIRRRAIIVNTLWALDDRQKVSQVLSRAPAEWPYILDERNIQDLDLLMARAAELETHLVVSSRTGADTSAMIRDEVHNQLRAIQAAQRAARPPATEPSSSYNFRRPPPARNAHVADGMTTNNLIDFLDEPHAHATSSSPASDPQYDVPSIVDTYTVSASDIAIHEAEIFLASRARSRPAPKDGYPFERDPRVSDPKPPSECKCCGGWHWDRDCKHWPEYEKRKRSPQAFKLSTERPIEEETVYGIVYRARANNKFVSAYFLAGETFERESYLNYARGADRGLHVTYAGEQDDARTELPSPPVEIEEVPDAWNEWYSLVPKMEGTSLLDDCEPHDAYREPDSPHEYYWILDDVYIPENPDDQISFLPHVQEEEVVGIDSSDEQPGSLEHGLPLRDEKQQNDTSIVVEPVTALGESATVLDEEEEQLRMDAPTLEPEVTDEAIRPSVDPTRVPLPPPSLMESLGLEIHQLDEFTEWLSTPAGIRALTASNRDVPFSERIDAAEILVAALNAEVAPTPTPERVFTVVPKRQPPAGRSSVGVSVLTAGGHLGSRDERPLPLRLDSGANISLISRAFLESMKNPPKIHTGLKVHLWKIPLVGSFQSK
ncbi:hypothetical protein EXIGLDRAFT_769680 [Exidia glandulosa HHB12029]|uniref:Peptidase A2 domain-containing protein n=1 Tax=Exidia glandulosa HHB12029 TaxID=1314781 RepID=A0A166AGD5_EXIGL|nr:hypothetical protein EXIGLDRAFT_769680 [Exidia glandulosa HHB12029]